MMKRTILSVIFTIWVLSVFSQTESKPFKAYLVNDDYETGATVKRFYKEADHIRLQPENDYMDPIIARDVIVVGKVKGVFRYFN